MAGLSNAAMIIAANALRGAMVGAQLHSAAAGSSGTANLCASARQAVTWAAATANGDFDLATQVGFTGGAGSGAIYSVTLWSTSTTGGVFYGEIILTGDTTFNAAGEYTLVSLAGDGSAS